MDLDNSEVFYSKISDFEELFYFLDRRVQYLVSVEQPYQTRIQRSCELSNACVTIVRRAMHYRIEHHVWYLPSEGLTPWYSKPVVHNGIWSVASFMLQLVNEIPRLDMSAKSEVNAHLQEQAEVLLEGYTGAITARVERGEEHKGLLNYCNRWDVILDYLYQQVKGSVDYQDINEATEEKYVEILKKLSLSLLSIAKRHEGYDTICKICCDLNDLELLRNLMHEGMGPQGGFCQFVSKQLYKKRQFSKLLRLGEEFQEELSVFVQYHQNLLWLHEVFLHQFSAASETLHLLALSEGEGCIVAAEDDEDTDHVMPTLADRMYLLNLAKLAAMAGKDADSAMRLKRIEADPKILKLQEEIYEVLPGDEVKQYVGGSLLPEELIELCLQSEDPKLALLAFDLFAWTVSSFRKSHRNLLEECWKNAANQDDWAQLYEASIEEGWSDKETLQQLRDTLLFQASRRCYGLIAETIDEGFDEVLPLRQGNMEVGVLRDTTSSVEAILMQHKEFPYADKLLLTAIMLCSVQDADVRAEDGPSPME